MDAPTITSSEFEVLLDNFLTEHKNNYVSKAALKTLEKTFHSRNITIQDWNTIVDFLKHNITNVDEICELLTHLSKFIIRDSSIVDQYDAKIEEIRNEFSRVTTLEGQVTDITESYVPKGIRVFNSINPKTMTNDAQSEAMLYVDNNGAPSKVPISGLDYNKMSIVPKENQTPLHFGEDIRIGDYYIEED